MGTLKSIYEEIERRHDRMHQVTTTSGRWYHLNIIIDLINNNPSIQEFYCIVEAHFLVDRVQKIKDFCISSSVKMNKPLPTENKEYAYIIELPEQEMIKVGKTNCPTRRFYDLSKKYGLVEPIEIFEFDNTEDAFLMEVILHKYFKEIYPDSEFVPQDRFSEIGVCQKDIDILREIAIKISQMKWF